MVPITNFTKSKQPKITNNCERPNSSSYYQIYGVNNFQFDKSRH